MLEIVPGDSERLGPACRYVSVLFSQIQQQKGKLDIRSWYNFVVVLAVWLSKWCLSSDTVWYDLLVCFQTGLLQPMRSRTSGGGQNVSGSLKLIYVFRWRSSVRKSPQDGTNIERHGCTFLRSQKQRQKVFPSSVSRSGSSEASVQIQTTALQPQSLNWPLTHPTAAGRQHGDRLPTERPSFPSFNCFCAL